MFANNTVETCTGTGNDLILAGAVTFTNEGGIDETTLEFGDSFADGDLASCFVIDSGGVIQVAGIYMYVAATNKLTRNDTWNWNGTVVDKNPSSNITLSGGIHIVRCDVSQSLMHRKKLETANPNGSNGYHLGVNTDGNLWTATNITTANRMGTVPVEFDSPITISELKVYIDTIDAAATHFRIGLYDSDDEGRPLNLLVDSGDMSASVGATGAKTVTLGTPIRLNAGTYYAVVVSDSVTVKYKVTANSTERTAAWNSWSSNGLAQQYYMNNVTGALPVLFVVNGRSISTKAGVGFA